MNVHGRVKIAREPKYYLNDSGSFAHVMVEEKVGRQGKVLTWNLAAYGEIADEFKNLAVGQTVEFDGHLAKYKNKKNETWETSIVVDKFEKEIVANVVAPELQAAEDEDTGLPFDL